MPLARDFRKMGRDALSGNWLLAVLVTLLAVLLGGAVYSGCIHDNYLSDSCFHHRQQRGDRYLLFLYQIAAAGGLRLQ